MKAPRCSSCYSFASAVLACSLLLSAHAAELIVNGGFESGLAGWTRVDQVGGEGTFFAQSGSTSPLVGLAVPPPPEGAQAAMTDSQGPGSHVLYQDFIVAVGSTYTLGFSLFVGNLAEAFYVPSPSDTLDFATPALNQQARVDIMTSSSAPFSISASDVLLNLYRTNLNDPLVSGYNDFSVDVTGLLAAHQGETLRLRFAEVDNVSTFEFGVDRVSLTTTNPTNAVPDTLSSLPQTVSIIGVLVLGSFYRRRSLSVNGRA